MTPSEACVNAIVAIEPDRPGWGYRRIFVPDGEGWRRAENLASVLGPREAQRVQANRSRSKLLRRRRPR